MYISLENMNCQDIGHCKSNIADREGCASFMLPDHFHDVTYDHIWAKTQRIQHEIQDQSSNTEEQTAT